MFFNLVYILFTEMGIMARGYATVVNILCKLIILLIWMSSAGGDASHRRAARAQPPALYKYDLLFCPIHSQVQIYKFHS